MGHSQKHPNSPGAHLIAWDRNLAPLSEQECEAKLHQEGYEVFRWTDVAGTSYPGHRHNVDECLWILKGSIQFTVNGKEYALEPGDRLYLPSGTKHTAQVPTSGYVIYLVGQKR